MHHARDGGKRLILELVAPKERLEAAVAVVMCQVDAANVEPVASGGMSSGSSTKTNVASGSMKLRMSHAQAARSTWQ